MAALHKVTLKLNLTLHQRRSSVCLFAGSVTHSIPSVMGRTAVSVGAFRL